MTKDSSQILIIRTDTLSHQWALLTSKAQTIERIFAGTRFTDSKRCWVSRYSAGNSLSVLIKEHCFTKEELKVFAFTKLSVKNVLFWRIGGILGIGNLCKIKQYFLEVIAGSFGDFSKQENHLDLTSLIALLHLEVMSRRIW